MDLKELENQMITDCNLILSSIDNLEKEINAQLLLFEKAGVKGNIKESNNIEFIILSLLKKLSLEEKEMDKFLIKYKKAIIK